MGRMWLRRALCHVVAGWLSLSHTRCRWRRVSWGERFVRCMHKFKAQEERDEKGEKVLGSRENMKEHGCASGYDSAAR